jgi:hypothetical protein
LSDDRAFLESLVNHTVCIEGLVQRHEYVEADDRSNLIAVSAIGPVLVDTPSGRQLVDHLYTRGANQLRQYPPVTRLKFCARVRQYVRADGTQSYGLGSPHSIELVQVPPCVKTANEVK